MKLCNIRDLLAVHPIETSAPCRIDFGGTLDIGTFHYPLRHMAPATVNIALDRRTTVGLHPNVGDGIRISSKGVADDQFAPASAPYDHPLGLMFAVVDYFGANGVHVQIESASPPKSGLGGSSVAAVALIAAFSKVLVRMGRAEITRDRMVILAQAIEQAVAGTACGFQDHLAAAFGGVNAWKWPAAPGRPPFARRPLIGEKDLGSLNRHLLLAYMGFTHVSKDVNATWIQRFISGKDREKWRAIIHLTHDFAAAVERRDMQAAAAAMNRETAIRKAMTPHVLDTMGDRLATAAIEAGCGARFTGAGGGGCLWAMGEADAVAALKPVWKTILAQRPTAKMIDCRVDANGVG